MRETPPGEQAKTSDTGVKPGDTAETKDRERPIGAVAGGDDEAKKAQVGAPAATGANTGATAEELPSEQVVHLSKGEGATGDAETAAGGAAQEPAP